MRHAMLMIAVFIASFAAPAAAQAATATTTTLDVPSGTQYGSFTVTAHVTPAPQPTNGFLPGVLFIVDGGGGLPAPLDSNGDASLELSLDPGSHTIKASFGPFADWEASESAAEGVQVGVATQVRARVEPQPGPGDAVGHDHGDRVALVRDRRDGDHRRRIRWLDACFGRRGAR